MNITQLIKDNHVSFVEYRKGFFYYRIKEPSDNYHIFPVPLDDIGDATLKFTDKAIYFMRYIRKAIEEGTFIKE